MNPTLRRVLVNTSTTKSRSLTREVFQCVPAQHPARSSSFPLMMDDRDWKNNRQRIKLFRLMVCAHHSSPLYARVPYVNIEPWPAKERQ